MKCTITIKQLSPNLWNLNEPWGESKEHFGHMTVAGAPHVDAYLVTGTKKAVLIDCMESFHTVPLHELLRTLTSLPIEVYFTHGHGDHVGAETANLLKAGYPMHLSLSDMDLMYSMANHFFGEIPSWMKSTNFIDLHGGESIDLGECTLETFAVPGHTQGCICFLDRKNHCCFTGDAFGTLITGKSTLSCCTLDDFLHTVENFEKWVNDDSCILYNGHAANLNGPFWTIRDLRAKRRSFPKEIEKLF